MKTAGVRELRQRASELLRLVGLGESVEITDRGRPVALLTPLARGTALERMRATGDVETATADPLDLPEPLTIEPGTELPSEHLARLREHER
jgi:prevent-host-death family protein